MRDRRNHRDRREASQHEPPAEKPRIGHRGLSHLVVDHEVIADRGERETNETKQGDQVKQEPPARHRAAHHRHWTPEHRHGSAEQ